MEPFGEIGANSSLQLSSRTQFAKTSNKKVIAENQCEKHKTRVYYFIFTTLECIIVQALISVQALVFDLAQLTCQKKFDCRNAIPRSSAILLGTSYSQIVVAALL